MAPWIAPGSTIIPSDGPNTGDFYGLVRGETVPTKSGTIEIHEQWVLASKDRLVDGGKVSMKKFLLCLPLASVAGGKADTFDLHWRKRPGGGDVPPMEKRKAFKDRVRIKLLNHDLHDIRYAAGTSVMSKGKPPMPSDDGIPASTKGIVQLYSIDETGCKWSVFAMLPEPPDSGGNSTVDQKRRVLQAWYESECKIAGQDRDYKPIIRSSSTTRSNYEDWRKTIGPWDPDLTRTADGEIYIDRDGDWKVPGFEF